MEDITEMLKGILEGLVMEIISHHQTYGYEITKVLNDYGFDDIVEGTVYTVLIRLERDNLVTIEKIKSDKGPARKMYSLNKEGKLALKQFWKKYQFINNNITKIKENLL
ncbi:MAG: PadR family transcriptional regulator [Bacilli bacterium]|jgi:PadR family transcriptional regulator PadR|nr:PadR family transcriptional regulator [Bacilli bacterium]